MQLAHGIAILGLGRQRPWCRYRTINEMCLCAEASAWLRGLTRWSADWVEVEPADLLHVVQPVWVRRSISPSCQRTRRQVAADYERLSNAER